MSKDPYVKKDYQPPNKAGQIIPVVESLPAALPAPLSVQAMKAQSMAIAEMLKEILVIDVHYGTIPGTERPTLFKSGSDKLLSAFHIALDPIIEDHSGPDLVKYLVRAQGIHMATGRLVGVGIGLASSSEEKYCWKRANDKEYDRAPVDRRRLKYVQQYKSTNIWENKQIRTNPADVANTVLKMAKKRAQVDLTLTALAASDVFDLATLPAENDNGNGNGSRAPVADPRDEVPDFTEMPDDRGPVNTGEGHPSGQSVPSTARSKTSAPAQDAKPVSEGKASGADIHKVRQAAAAANLRDIDVMAELGVVAWNQMPADKVEITLAWITIRHAADAAGISDMSIFEQLGIEAWKFLEADQVINALDWIKEQTPAGPPDEVKP